MLKKRIKHSQLINNFTASYQWFRKFLLSSLCAAAVAMPTGAWGAWNGAAGVKKNSGEAAILDHNLHIENGSTKTGEHWALINSSADVTTATNVQNIPIYGAYSSQISGNASAAMSGNVSLAISGTGTFEKEVYGGYAIAEDGSAAANSNTLAISGGTFKTEISAGYAAGDGDAAAANSNHLTISGGTFGGSTPMGVYAGYVYGADYRAVAAEASSNILEISGGTFNNWVSAGYVQGTDDTAAANSNHLTISGEATFNKGIYAGYAESDETSAAANSNILEISGNGTFNEMPIYGGQAAFSNTGNGSAAANSNILTISGGTFNADILGGSAYAKNGSAAANSNILTISGGTFNREIYGGRANVENSTGTATAKDNIVIIEGSPKLENAVLNGGVVEKYYAAVVDPIANNTLKIRTAGLTARNVRYFQNYVFVLPNTVQDGDTILKLSEGETDLGSNTTVSVAVKKGTGLKNEESITLIENSGTITMSGITQGTVTGEEGIAEEYKFTLDTTTANKLIAKVSQTAISEAVGTTDSPLTKALTITADGKTDASWGAFQNIAIKDSYVFGVKVNKESGDAHAAMSGDGSLTILGTGSGTDSPKYVYGAYAVTYSGKAEAKDAKLNIYGGTFNMNVYSGFADGSKSAKASNNTMTIFGGTFNNYAYSGNACSQNGKATANNNTLEISGGAFGDDVRGGFAHVVEGTKKAEANNNAVSISGGTFSSNDVHSVHSGYARSDNGKAESSNNSLDISGKNSFTYYIFGGLASTKTGDGSAIANNNTVTISGNSTFTKPIFAANADRMSGGSGNGSAKANNNSLAISGGAFAFVSDDEYNGVFAGYAEVNSGSGNAEANNNTLTISGGKVTSEGAGVFVGSSAGYAVSLNGVAIAKNNSTIILGGAFLPYNHEMDIYGGCAETTNGTATADNNTLTISGGAFGTKTAVVNLIAGYAIAPSADNASASNNTMIIQGSPNLAYAALYGGVTDRLDPSSPNGVASINGTIKNNTLEIRTAYLNALNVYNFQNYNFILPSGIKNNDVVLTLSGGADKEKTNIRGSAVTVEISQGVLLYPGDKIVLLRNENGLISTGFTQKKITAEKGLALSYNFDVMTTPTELFAAVSSVKASEKAKAPVEGQTVAPALLNQAADILAAEGMQSLVAMPANGTMGTFGVAQAGNLRHNTGSHTNVQGVSTLIGIGKRFDPSYGVLYTGAFFEYGYGDYSAHNDFSSGYVRGDGHSRYYGGGVMVHYDIPCGAYAEASVRFGGSESYWSSKQLAASYDSTGMYFGAHVALGWMWKFAKDFKLDLYSKYFYAYQEGDNVTILGDPFKFDSVNSNRLRLGARLGYDFNEMIAGYAGAGWEREFSGTANAAVYGYDIAAPSLKGNSGIFEGGLSFKPKKDLAFSTDIGVVGYVGYKKGVTGYLKLNYSF